MENSAIGWLKRGDVNGATWNPWISCSHATYVGYDGREHVHPGCLNCYAESLMDDRYHKCVWGSNGNRVVTSPAYWRKPASWEKRAAKDGVRVPVFPSLCDPFEVWTGAVVAPIKKGELEHRTMWKCMQCDTRLIGVAFGEHPVVPECDLCGTKSHVTMLTMLDVRRDMFSRIDATPSLDWILFTKRPENVPSMWTPHPDGGINQDEALWRHNVTLCYSPANQETLDHGAPFLLRCVDLCQTIGLSIEPMLGPVDLRAIGRNSNGWPAINALTGERRVEQGPTTRVHDGPRVGWVIVGCESNGPRVGRLGVPSRNRDGSTTHIQTDAEWWEACADVVRQCREAGVPCFVKQGPRNGRVVHEPKDFPAACRAREFPERKAIA